MATTGTDDEEVRVVAGVSAVVPDPKDERFADAAWTHPWWRRVAQSYLTTRSSILGAR